MITHAQRTAILSSLHQARKEQGLPDATLREDAAAMQQVRSTARAFGRSSNLAEEDRRKALANLSATLSKANAAVDEVRNCSGAMAALRAVAPEDIDGEAVASEFNTLADGLWAFAELSASAMRLPGRRKTIESLIEFFAPAYKRHTGAIPAVRRAISADTAGPAAGPFVQYICAIAVAVGFDCKPEGVASAFKRMDEEGKHWLQAPDRPAAQRFGAFLESIEATD